MEPDEVYEPREDSFLMQEYVEEFSKAKELVLDMGTGSGILAITAAKYAKHVVALDINQKAVNCVQLEIRSEKIKNLSVFQSDLFSAIERKRYDLEKKNLVKSAVKNQFDLIIFNPPYLIEELDIRDDALFGGKRGIETTEKFLVKARDYLKDEGIILITSSSLVNQKRLAEIFEENLLESETIDSFHAFFEDVYVHKIVKKDLLKKLNSKGVSDVSYFEHGKRGVIYTGIYKNTKVAVKARKKESFAGNTIENEISFLQKLSNKKIGPELVLFGDGYLGYKFIEGERILDFSKNAKKKEIIKVLVGVFEKCYAMDQMRISKFEMQNPYKHILVDKKGKPHMIDFERARHTEDPKNVTQFCDFLISMKYRLILEKKDIIIDKKRMIDAAKEYRKNMDKKNFENIIVIVKKA